MKRPEGCDCIDDHIVVYNGLRILGLGGCKKYRPGPFQYTEREMQKRIRRLKWVLWLLGGVDIVVTHAPAEGLGDAEDLAHQGFGALRDLLDEYSPQYLLHGHVHTTYGQNVSRELKYNGTKIINTYERYVLDVPDVSFPEKHRGQILWKTPHREPQKEGSGMYV